MHEAAIRSQDPESSCTQNHLMNRPAPHYHCAELSASYYEHIWPHNHTESSNGIKSEQVGRPSASAFVRSAHSRSLSACRFRTSQLGQEERRTWQFLGRPVSRATAFGRTTPGKLRMSSPFCTQCYCGFRFAWRDPECFLKPNTPYQWDAIITR